MDDYKTQLARFRLLSDEELARPLWEVPWDQRKAFLSARERRRYAGWKLTAEDGEIYRPSEAAEVVTEWSPTE